MQGLPCLGGLRGSFYLEILLTQGLFVYFSSMKTPKNRGVDAAMKLFSTAQIKACDAYTIQSEGISSVALMERAAVRCTEWLMARFSKERPFMVLCGTGNNGGDGLAITRILHHAGYSARAFLVQYSRELSGDCHDNLQRLLQADKSLLTRVEAETFVADVPENIVIIDALLGTGLSRPLEGWLQQFIRHIAQFNNLKIAIDIPSGLPADNVPDPEATVLSVDHTLSFQFYKRSFLHPEGGQYAGRVWLLDIGLSLRFTAATPTSYTITDAAVAQILYRPRTAFSHKGTYGHAWITGGSYGMTGAVVLCARAALRAGAGRVTTVVPETGYGIVQTAVPEAICMTGGERCIADIRIPETADAIGIGPGMGTDRRTMRAFELMLDTCRKPLVIDADALNILAERKELLHKLPPETILTPHPKEFERLFGKTVNSMLRLEHARTQAMRYNVFIVLKDHYTAVIAPDGTCRYNMSGDTALATAGSGDVLTGVITGLLAQGYSSLHAAQFGVYLHGLAGTIAGENQQATEAVLAGDVIACMGAAFRKILSASG